MSKPLVALIEKERGSTILETLKDTGIVDRTRRIEEANDRLLAVPVTDVPSIDVEAVCVDHDPTYRKRTLTEILAAYGWTPAERDRAPSSWAVIGSVILVSVPPSCPDEEDLAAALLELHPTAETVLAREGITGETRTPQTRILAGSTDTETVHREHGIEYALDPTEVMFSPGNKRERLRMAAAVAAGRDRASPVLAPPSLPDRVDSCRSETTHETVFDMFAGVGYFAIPAAIGGATVTATELNPTAVEYLRANARRNDVSDRLLASQGDCREHSGTADRVIMGYYEAPTYLETALDVVCSGGVIHLHAAVPTAVFPDRPRNRLKRALDQQDKTASTVSERIVKSYAEGVVHGVVDVRVH